MPPLPRPPSQRLQESPLPRSGAVVVSLPRPLVLAQVRALLLPLALQLPPRQLLALAQARQLAPLARPLQARPQSGGAQRRLAPLPPHSPRALLQLLAAPLQLPAAPLQSPPLQAGHLLALQRLGQRRVLARQWSRRKELRPLQGAPRSLLALAPAQTWGRPLPPL